MQLSDINLKETHIMQLSDINLKRDPHNTTIRYKLKGDNYQI